MSHGDRSERVAFLRDAITKIEAGQSPGPASRDSIPASISDREDVRAPRRVMASAQPASVMAGLVPAMTAAPLQQMLEIEARGSAWMPGTRPGMTPGDCRRALRTAEQSVSLGGTEDGTALDAALGGGLDRNGVHEIVASTPADAWATCGFALALAARFAAATSGAGGALLWVIEDFAAHETGAPYGPGLAAHGLDPHRLVLVHAVKSQDALWVMEEALRAKALAAVVGEIWSVKDYGLAASRRLLLAARASRTPCILIQAGAAGKAALLSSTADTRFAVAARRSGWEAAADGLPLPGHPAWSVRLAKAKGSLGFDRERSFHLVWDPAERCLRDEPVSTLPIPVHRPALSGDRTRPAPHESHRQAAGA